MNATTACLLGGFRGSSHLSLFLLSFRHGQPVKNKPGVFEINRELKGWHYNFTGKKGCTKHQIIGHQFEVHAFAAVHTDATKYIYMGKAASSPFKITSRKSNSASQEHGFATVGSKHGACDSAESYGSGSADSVGSKRLKAGHFHNEVNIQTLSACPILGNLHPGIPANSPGYPCSTPQTPGASDHGADQLTQRKLMELQLGMIQSMQQQLQARPPGELAHNLVQAQLLLQGFTGIDQPGVGTSSSTGTNHDSIQPTSSTANTSSPSRSHSRSPSSSPNNPYPSGTNSPDHLAADTSSSAGETSDSGNPGPGSPRGSPSSHQDLCLAASPGPADAFESRSEAPSEATGVKHLHHQPVAAAGIACVQSRQQHEEERVRHQVGSHAF
jgi:hypothetical protein